MIRPQIQEAIQMPSKRETKKNLYQGMFNQITEQNLSKRNLFSVKKSDKEEVLKAARGGTKLTTREERKR